MPWAIAVIMKLKPRFLISAALACAIPFFALSAVAARDYTKLYGNPAPASSANPTIAIQPGTRYVNVQGGDTVNFVSGGKTFGWSFNVARTVKSFELNEVAPAGVLDHPVTVYVSPDPKYTGP